jgi:hypothetical protein
LIAIKERIEASKGTGSSDEVTFYVECRMDSAEEMDIPEKQVLRIVLGAGRDLKVGGATERATTNASRDALCRCLSKLTGVWRRLAQLGVWRRFACVDS